MLSPVRRPAMRAALFAITLCTSDAASDGTVPPALLHWSATSGTGSSGLVAGAPQSSLTVSGTNVESSVVQVSRVSVSFYAENSFGGGFAAALTTRCDQVSIPGATASCSTAIYCAPPSTLMDAFQRKRRGMTAECNCRQSSSVSL